MSRMNWRGAREQGFTLLETMMVVGITGVVTAIAVVQFQVTRNMVKGDSAMRQVLAQMNAARQMAMQQRRYIDITFDTTHNTIILVREDTTTTSTTLSTAMFENNAKIQLTTGLPDTPDAFGNGAATSFYNPTNGTFQSLNGSTTVAKFAPDGTLVDWNGFTTNGTIFTAIPNLGPSSRAVTILGSTGRFRGYRWDGKHWVTV